MNEEEKKTFNFLKTFVKTEIDYCKLEKADVLDILNIIEKQQKEIQQLKYSITKAIKIIDEYANETEKDTKKLIEYQENLYNNY